MASTLSATDWALEQCRSFGELLRFARRRAGLTQRELSIAVGYSEAQISRLEKNQRLPDPAVISARFIPALSLQGEPGLAEQLLRLAAGMDAANGAASGAPGHPPFKGLLPFQESDAALFFGRNAASTLLARRLRALAGQTDGLRLMALTGDSGCGKSSLVRAGVLPALRRWPESARWPVHVLTPGAGPLAALGAAAGGAVSESDLAARPAALAEALANEARRARAGTCLLVVDQFEELFSLAPPDQQAAFVAGLLEAAAGPAVALIVLRADYYSHLARFPRLAEALAEHQIFLGPMTGTDLRQAIEAPAAQGGWELEPGLVELILRDSGGAEAGLAQSGALPLLAHALRETWERRRGRQLTLRAYMEAGGMQGALAQTAEMVLNDRLGPDQRPIARRLFLSLTQPTEAGAEVLRRAPLTELFAQGESETSVHAVLTALADARLIVMDQACAQIAHEALLHAWPTLRAWLEESRELRRWHHQLAQAAQEWQALGRDPGLLYRGARLHAALEWAELGSATEPLGALAEDFLSASRAQAEAEAREQEARRQAETAAARQLADSERARADEHARAARQLRRLVAALTAALALALALGGLSIYLDERNLQLAASAQAALRLAYAREVAESALSQASTDAELGLILAWHAVRATYPDDGVVAPEARAALAQTLGGSAARDLPALGTASPPVVLDPWGALAALRGRQGLWQVWDLAAASPAFTLPVSADAVQALGFGPGQIQLTALIAGPDGPQQLGWDLPAGRPKRPTILPVSFSAGGPAALSPDGRRAGLWSVADRRLTVLEFGTSQPTAAWEWTGAPPVLLGLDAQGTRLAAAWADGSLRLFELADARSRSLATGAAGPPTGLAFTPDGGHLAAAFADGSLQVWDTAAGQLAIALPGPGAQPLGLAFSSDGARLLTADRSGALRDFPVEVEAALAAVGARGVRPLTVAECQRFLHRETCPPGP